MGATLRLPNEVQQFLDLPGPQSLLLRGPPGSGKTTMALAMLEAFQGKKLLVSSRVSRDDLSRGFPWLGTEGVGTIEVVDTSSDVSSVKDSARTASALRALLKAGEDDEGPLRDFLWLPPAIKQAWSLLPEKDRAIVVVDSWDALVEEYVGPGMAGDESLPGRDEIERLLLRQMGRTNAHLILVLERAEQTQLDYLVNGTVVTQREMRADRLERWLALPKLRGIRIANASYPYTLEGARFECIEPIRAYSQLSIGRFAPEPDRIPGYLWPGSEPFAEAFGRLPLGKITLLDRGEGVLHHAPRLLVSPMIANALEAGCHVVLTPQVGMTPEEVWNEMRGGVSKRKFLQGLRMLELDAQDPRSRAGEFAPVLVQLEKLASLGGGRRPEDNELIRFLADGATAEHPSLLVVYLTGLEFLAQQRSLSPSSPGSPTPSSPPSSAWKDAFPPLIRSLVAGNFSTAMIVGRAEDPLVPAIREMSNLDLHLEARQGRLLVHGSNPWTPWFVLTDSSEKHPYGLLRVV